MVHHLAFFVTLLVIWSILAFARVYRSSSGSDELFRGPFSSELLLDQFWQRFLSALLNSAKVLSFFLYQPIYQAFWAKPIASYSVPKEFSKSQVSLEPFFGFFSLPYFWSPYIQVGLGNKKEHRRNHAHLRPTRAFRDMKANGTLSIVNT